MDLFNRLNFLPADDFDDRDIYKYAMLYLKYGDKTEAVKIMRKIVQTHPDTTASRKALFVLAGEAQKARDYETAIDYYSIYIERYPEKTFYAQKAYQRIVDCHLARGDKGFSKELMKQVADWVNGIADYRSQLNLAVDLKSKNMDKLAEVTFYTGHDEAMRLIMENPESYDALKAYLEIQRAAYVIRRHDIVEQAAIATLTEFENLRGNTEFNSNASFIKSQAYLWLSKIYKEHKRHHETIKMLEEFLRLFPEHKDKDYALYELGRAHENIGMKEKAKAFYMNVKSGQMKNMAQDRLVKLR